MMASSTNSESDSSSEPTIREFMEMGKKFRPSSEVLKKMSDEDFYNILQKNWMEWTGGDTKRSFTAEIPDEGLPDIFQHCNTSSIKLFRALDKKEVEDRVDDSFIDGVTGGRYSMGEAGSSQGFTCLDYCLPTMNHLVKGARFWVIIPPGEASSKLEKLCARIDKKEPKSGCLGGIHAIELPILRKENIEYKTSLQREDDIVFTYPGEYYYWFNLIHFTEVMSVYFTTDDWFEMGKKREVERCTCRKKFTLNWAKMEAEGRTLKITTKAEEKAPEGQKRKSRRRGRRNKKKAPEDKENSEQATEDQGAALLSEGFEKVTMN